MARPATWLGQVGDLMKWQTARGPPPRRFAVHLRLTQICDSCAMPRTRGPGNLVARRPTTVARIDADAHNDYAAMIQHDFGGRQPSYRAIDNGLPPSTLALMMRPLALFLFACTGLVIVSMLWLYHAGLFGKIRIGERPPPPPPSVSWMGARRAAAPVSPAHPTSHMAASKAAEAKPEPAAVNQDQAVDPAEAAENETTD